MMFVLSNEVDNKKSGTGLSAHSLNCGLSRLVSETSTRLNDSGPVMGLNRPATAAQNGSRTSHWAYTAGEPPVGIQLGCGTFGPQPAAQTAPKRLIAFGPQMGGQLEAKCEATRPARGRIGARQNRGRTADWCATVGTLSTVTVTVAECACFLIRRPLGGARVLRPQRSKACPYGLSSHWLRGRSHMSWFGD
jgi:hypothetical protein